MSYYAGLDVSMNTTFICIVNEKGKVVKELESASTPEAIHSFLSESGLQIEKVGLESSLYRKPFMIRETPSFTYVEVKETYWFLSRISLGACYEYMIRMAKNLPIRYQKGTKGRCPF